MPELDAIYIGTLDGKMESRSRLVIPAQHREIIAAVYPEKKDVVWSIAEKRANVPYILIFDSARLKAYWHLIDARELTKYELDDQGRITLNLLQQVQANFKKGDSVKIVALYDGEAFEIWNADNFKDFTVDKRSLEQRLISKLPPDNPIRSAI